MSRESCKDCNTRNGALVMRTQSPRSIGPGETSSCKGSEYARCFGWRGFHVVTVKHNPNRRVSKSLFVQAVAATIKLSLELRDAHRVLDLWLLDAGWSSAWPARRSPTGFSGSTHHRLALFPLQCAQRCAKTKRPGPRAPNPTFRLTTKRGSVCGRSQVQP